MERPYESDTLILYEWGECVRKQNAKWATIHQQTKRKGKGKTQKSFFDQEMKENPYLFWLNPSTPFQSNLFIKSVEDGSPREKECEISSVLMCTTTHIDRREEPT
jgi:hypothetical protein